MAELIENCRPSPLRLQVQDYPHDLLLQEHALTMRVGGSQKEISCPFIFFKNYWRALTIHVNSRVLRLAPGSHMESKLSLPGSRLLCWVLLCSYILLFLAICILAAEESKFIMLSVNENRIKKKPHSCLTEWQAMTCI